MTCKDLLGVLCRTDSRPNWRLCFSHRRIARQPVTRRRIPSRLTPTAITMIIALDDVTTAGFALWAAWLRTRSSGGASKGGPRTLTETATTASTVTPSAEDSESSGVALSTPAARSASSADGREAFTVTMTLPPLTASVTSSSEAAPTNDAKLLRKAGASNESMLPLTLSTTVKRCCGGGPCVVAGSG